MPKRINFTLSDEQERELKAAKSDKRAEVRQRAPTLRMLSQGHKSQVVERTVATQNDLANPHCFSFLQLIPEST
jgi:hypothetical protein